MTHRTFISIILAAAIAVTGMTAAPARADNDAAKVIAGVAALAIIGAVIAEERKDRRRSHLNMTSPTVQYPLCCCAKLCFAGLIQRTKSHTIFPFSGSCEGR